MLLRITPLLKAAVLVLKQLLLSQPLQPPPPPQQQQQQGLLKLRALVSEQGQSHLPLPQLPGQMQQQRSALQRALHGALGPSPLHPLAR